MATLNIIKNFLRLGKNIAVGKNMKIQIINYKIANIMVIMLLSFPIFTLVNYSYPMVYLHELSHHIQNVLEPEFDALHFEVYTEKCFKENVCGFAAFSYNESRISKHDVKIKILLQEIVCYTVCGIISMLITFGILFIIYKKLEKEI